MPHTFLEALTPSQCNGTGQYAHYASSTVGTGGGGESGGTPPSGSGGAGSGFPSTSEVATSTLGPYSGADDPAAGAFLNTTMEDNETFLRAVYPTECVSFFLMDERGRG